MLRCPSRATPRDAAPTISYIVCMGILVEQVFQNIALRKSLGSPLKWITKPPLDLDIQTYMLQFASIRPPRGTRSGVYCIVTFLTALLLSFGILSWRKLRKADKGVDETGNLQKYQELTVLKAQHETAAILSDLVETDGAGAWPPRSEHNSWPAALKPYKDIYLECIPLLPAADPSTNDDVNQERRGRYCARMRALLQERINVAEVEKVMKDVESGDWNACPKAAYNAIYCCVAVCRHAYRWV
ncbi:MAG: hypothetical protein Q9166_006934 [cf. Caloplaca sp. 2 TL-2023]